MFPALIAVISIAAVVGAGILYKVFTASDSTSDFAPATKPSESSAETPASVPESVPDRKFANRFSIDELCRRLELPLQQLQNHQCTYQTVEIAKKNGGFRRLEIPDDSTKKLQRTLLKRLLLSCQSHPMACAFEEGASIVDAAVPHQQQPVIIKMDVRHFFESTTTERIRNWFLSIGWTEDAADLLTRLTTYHGHLPQGAPTSPRLSNLVNAPLDHGLLQLARLHGGNYSRYADDITMSFEAKHGRVLRGITQVVRRILRSYGYTMHGGKKLNLIRSHQQQLVLGLVVNHKVALPRKTRRWLRSVRHRIDNGQPASLTPEQLRGWEALQTMIEKQRSDAD